MREKQSHQYKSLQYSVSYLSSVSKIFFLLFLTSNIHSQWIVQPSGTSNLLTSVFFSDNNSGSAVGLSGTVRRTTNGGINWIVQQNTPNEDFYGIFLSTRTQVTCAETAAELPRLLTAGRTGHRLHHQWNYTASFIF